MLCMQVNAQNDRSEILRVFQMVSDKYSTEPLRFEIKYYYADADKPNTLLDSLSGECILNKKSFWYGLDNTEIVSDSFFTVTLFKEDRLMYLSAPSKKALPQDPIKQFDTLLLNNKNIHFSLVRTGADYQISFEFDSVDVYKQMVFTVDGNRFLIKRVDNVVRASELYDPSVKSLLTTENKFAVVSMVMTNYRKETGTSFIDSRKYFTRQGDSFIANPPFENYKIFVGTPNL